MILRKVNVVLRYSASERFEGSRESLSRILSSAVPPKKYHASRFLCNLIYVYNPKLFFLDLAMHSCLAAFSKVRFILVFLCCALMLAACGGGGGGSGGNSGAGNSETTTPPSGASGPVNSGSITLSTGQVAGQVAYGSGALPGIDVTLAGTVGNVYALILVDKPGVISSNVQLAITGKNTAQATLQIPQDLAPGHYAGNMAVHLCKDSACGAEYSGSPVAMSYDFTVASPPPALSFKSATLAANADAGLPQALKIGAIRSKFLAAAASVTYKIVDSQSTLSQQPVNTKIDVSLREDVQLLPASVIYPTVGTVSGTLTIHACKDTACAAEYPGSPVTLPYSITVNPPLPASSGLPDWETYQGNAGHTGFVPVTLDLSHPSKRWAQDVGFVYSQLSIGSSKVFVLSLHSGDSGPSLYAYNEDDGSLAWQYQTELGNVRDVGTVAYSAGRVYATTLRGFFGFDVGGGVLFNRNYARFQLDQVVVKSGYAYENGQSATGADVTSFDLNGGALRWENNSGALPSWLAPLTLDDHYAYMASGGLWVVDPTTGRLAFMISDTGPNAGNYLPSELSGSTTPVVAGSDSVLAVSVFGNPDGKLVINHISNFRVSTRSIAWSVSGQFSSDPAVAGARFFVINGATSALEARQLSDGGLLWSWSPDVPSLVTSNIIVTNNVALVSTPSATYAVDLVSHQTVWSYPRGGHSLALSASRVLYILGEGSIDAINLF